MIKVQFSRVIALNRRTLRIIVTNFSQTQFMHRAGLSFVKSLNQRKSRS